MLFISERLIHSEIKGGYLLLSIDIKDIRNILSVYNSQKSPIWAYPRSQEVRYSFMFDKQGWILFQSDDPENSKATLSTDLARSGYDGTLGKPSLPFAFRPGSVYGNFWKMIGDIKEGESNLIQPENKKMHSNKAKDYYLAYSPVFFKKGEKCETDCIRRSCLCRSKQVNDRRRV